jgi:hypothetical protein
MPSNGNSKTSRWRIKRTRTTSRPVLVKPKKGTSRKKPTGVPAHRLHQRPVTRSNQQIRATIHHAGRHRRRQVIRDVLAALLIAVGLSTVFLSPLTHPNGDSREKILGQSIVVPLTVPVTLVNHGNTQTILTYPKYGTLPEALGQAAADQGTNFYYTTRGSSAYLWRFFNQVNDATGGWAVTVNGLVVTDLLSINLRQGDQITAERMVL